MAGDDASPAWSGAAAVVAVAYSGGRDSTALLHATVAAAVEAGVHVLALHVHHGLHPQADDWLKHCERQCKAWRRRGWPVTLHAKHLHLSPARGESIEAVARIARYRALREMAVTNGCDTVLLAHHRRDQAETFLLQALRGAGPSGLAAMPRVAVRDGLTWLRPWLDHPREAIDAYVRRHRLRHVDDTSNDDTRLARNRMRLTVWPALAAAFPDAQATLAEAARKAQDARTCLAQLAELDLAGCETPQGLRIASLRALGEARACNALRAWCRRCTGRALPAAVLGQVWHGVRTAHAVQWPLSDGHVLSLYRGRLSLSRPAPVLPAQQPAGTRAGHLSIRRAGLYRVPGWRGALRARRVRSGGMALSRLVALELVERVGGERFQVAHGRPPRSLKKQFQAGAIPAWERDGPLVYAQGQLAFVPGLGLDARVLAQPGEPQLSLQWEPDAGA